MEAAKEAGKIILKYYRKDRITDRKIDGSPLTLADQISHLEICKILGQTVLEAAGGAVLDWHTGEPLVYGKYNRRNGRLLSFRAPYVGDDFKLQSYKPILL